MNVGLIRFLDKYFGGFLCLVFGLFPKGKHEGSRRVLAIQLWGVGESILTLPALQKLKDVKVLATERNKDVYVGYNVDVIRVSPFSVLNYVIRNYGKYDVVADFEEYLNVSAIVSFFVGRRRIGYSHGIRSLVYTDKVRYNDRQHCSQTFMDLLTPLGIKGKVKVLVPLKFSSRDRKAVDGYLSKRNVRRNAYIVGISAGVAESARSRMWPLERFASLADRLSERKNAVVVFIGSKEERKLHESIAKMMKGASINACGDLTLPQAFYLVKKCSLIVGNDAGPMHIGAAMGTKTVGLFGPNLPLRFGPLNGRSIYKGGICKYSPCVNVHRGEVPNCYYRGKEYQKCMRNISVDDVLGAV